MTRLGEAVMSREKLSLIHYASHASSPRPPGGTRAAHGSVRGRNASGDDGEGNADCDVRRKVLQDYCALVYLSSNSRVS